MSSMLEQAIVDASALREAALKSAEQTVIDKYSDEIKEAVSSLLEVEDDMGLDDELALAGEELPAEEPLEGDSELDQGVQDQLPSSHSAGEVSSDDIEQLRSAISGAEAALGDVEQKVDQLDAQVKSGSDEMVKLDLDSLRSGVEDKMQGDETDMVDREELASGLEDSEPLGDQEEFELTEEMMKELVEEEEAVEISEQEIDEIVEKLVVDIQPQRTGWAGTPQATLDQAEDAVLAREQDTEVAEENEELRTAVDKLQKENKRVVNAAESIRKFNKDYEAKVYELTNKLNEVNVSNAKLLYTNRILSNNSLNERQKNKIVESIQNSNSVEEAKVVFETLQSAVGSSFKEGEPKSLSEAVSRNSSAVLLARTRDRDTGRPDHNFADRMKKLAGIT